MSFYLALFSPSKIPRVGRTLGVCLRSISWMYILFSLSFSFSVIFQLRRKHALFVRFTFFRLENIKNFPVVFRVHRCCFHCYIYTESSCAFFHSGLEFSRFLLLFFFPLLYARAFFNIPLWFCLGSLTLFCRSIVNVVPLYIFLIPYVACRSHFFFVGIFVAVCLIDVFFNTRHNHMQLYKRKSKGNNKIY